MKTGITGGIGSGKSYVCQLLRARGIEVYDCDAAAKRLLNTDPELMQSMVELIGPDAYICSGSPSVQASPHPTLNKAVVAQYLLRSEDHARAIDAIVHPAVFRDFQQSGLEWVESAILFQCGMRPLVDRAGVVTAPLEIRLQRVMQRDHITREKALEWVNRQWPQERLVELADMEIVNDGHVPLPPQIDRLLSIVGGNL